MSLDKQTMDSQRVLTKENTKHNWASNAGWARDCLRYGVLYRLYPERLKPFNIGQQRIMEDGEKREALTADRLEAAGYKVERKKTAFYEMAEIEAELDFIISDGSERALIEHKAIGQQTFEHVRKLKTIHDMRKSTLYYIWHYAHQLQLYLMLFKEQHGILLFQNRNRLNYHQIWMEKDHTWGNELIEIFHEINGHVSKNTLPAMEKKEICFICRFYGTACEDDESTVDLGGGTIDL
jgi:hypothetical protein